MCVCVVAKPFNVKALHCQVNRRVLASQRRSLMLHSYCCCCCCCFHTAFVALWPTWKIDVQLIEIETFTANSLLFAGCCSVGTLQRINRHTHTHTHTYIQMRSFLIGVGRATNWFGMPLRQRSAAIAQANSLACLLNNVFLLLLLAWLYLIIKRSQQANKFSCWIVNVRWKVIYCATNRMHQHHRRTHTHKHSCLVGYVE